MSEWEMYKDKSEDSLVLVVEFFNRPHDTGRLSSVLLHLNHSIEMLLKSILLRHDYGIRKENGRTIPLSKCLEILEGGTADKVKLNLISDGEKTTLDEIANHRNEAMHGNAVIGEQLLYAYTRSGLSIIDSLLNEVYDESLDDILPNRVLPISSSPLKHLDIIYQEEGDKIQELLDEGARGAARARVRAIELSDRKQRGEEDRPTNDELDDILDKIEGDVDFEDIFPGVSKLRFDIQGEGPTIKLQFTQSDGHPVHHISEEDDVEEYAIGYREVNPFDRYSLGVNKLAEKIGEKYNGDKRVNQNTVWAIVRKIDIHGNEKYHKELNTPYGGPSDRYSHKAISRVIEAIESGEVEPEEAWNTHGYS